MAVVNRTWRWDDYLALAVALAFGLLLVFSFRINHLDFGMGDGAAAMNQRRTVNAVGTASKILVSGRGLSPSAGPYLELFARETKPGWKCWGDQSGRFDAGSVATRRQPSRLVDAHQLLG